MKETRIQVTPGDIDYKQPRSLALPVAQFERNPV